MSGRTYSSVSAFLLLHFCINCILFNLKSNWSSVTYFFHFAARIKTESNWSSLTYGPWSMRARNIRRPK
jgi:hypothetical protein